MIESDDIDEMVRKLEQLGIDFNGIHKITEEGVSRFATFQNLEGNWLQLSQRIK